MLASIITIDKHGNNNHVLAMTFSIPSGNFDLMRAIRQTANDFCKTTNCCIYHGQNGNQLRWTDFCEHIPVQFQKKYGYQLVSYYDMGHNTLIRNMSENLIHIDTH